MRSLEPEIARYISREIERQLGVILSGVTQGTDPSKWTEDVGSLYPGADTILARPVMHPFGFVSRAPVGTLEVVARQGEHPTNRIVLGHRDANRPQLDEGTSKLYSAEGYQVYAGTDGIYVGRNDASQPLVLATPLNEFLGQLLDLLIAHVHPGPGSPTDKAADLTQLKTSITDNSLISTGAGGLG